MLNIIVYTDGKEGSAKALETGAILASRIGAQVSVLTIRSESYGTEEPPPVGSEFPLSELERLPPGLQILAEAASQLATAGFTAAAETIRIQDFPHGYRFLCRTEAGDPITFTERYGHFIECLNQEVDERDSSLVLIAPPLRKGLRRFVFGDTARLLALDLHASVMVVRGGDFDSRFLVCADGSASSRRQFPMLRHLMPAIRSSVDVLWVRTPDAADETVEEALHCLDHAREWLDVCGKLGRLQQREGADRLREILEAAGDGSVVVMGASLRHDVYRRTMGSLPIQVMANTESSVLLVKLAPETDAEFFKEPFTC
jgi:nucleotide-binding universal stress UspA family protein